MADLARPVHTLLLREGIPIVEHLRGLDRRGRLRFQAGPPMVHGVATVPVRACAVIGG